MSGGVHVRGGSVLSPFGLYDGLSFQNVTQYYEVKIIKDINISKSSAYADLSSKLLKDAFTVLCRELTYLFSIALSSGTFSNEWGLAKVTPIPKTGDLNNAKKLETDKSNKVAWKITGETDTHTIIDQKYKNIFQIWNEKAYSSCIFIDYSKDLITLCVLELRWVRKHKTICVGYT